MASRPPAPEETASPAGKLPWRAVPGGVELTARLTPRGGRAAVEGVGAMGEEVFLKVRVPAPPVDGAATAALVACLAGALDLPRSAVTLVAGERARIKRLRILGEGVAERLAEVVARIA